MRQLALPLYPGAQPTSNGIILKGPRARIIVAAYYRSADSLAKVEGYYARHLPKDSLKMYIHEADGGTAHFGVRSSGGQKQVVLASDHGGTLIALTHTTMRASPGLTRQPAHR